MVCIAVKGKPIIGVIYKPFETKQNSSLFWSWTNHAISKNLQILHKVINTKILQEKYVNSSKFKNVFKIS